MATLRKLDLIALTASGAATDRLHAFLTGLREDTASAIAGVTSIFHKGSSSVVVAADGSDLPTALTLVNELKGKVGGHLASTSSHLAASAEAIAAADATDLATAQTLANEIKADYNTHLTESGVHLNNDATNDVTSVDATDQASLETLINEIKADHNAHIASTMSTPEIA